MTESKRPPEWYRDWFGEEYLALYPHRDQEEAEAGVELMLRTWGRPDGLILDLACGAGRHIADLSRRGIRAVGLDLSAPLLRQARSVEPESMLVRADMRWLPFRDGSFGHVVNFFTSFGYFASPEDDAQTLEEIRRVLRQGGVFLLDFLNAPRVREALVDRDERFLGARRVLQRRRLEEGGRVVVKDIEIYEAGSSSPLARYKERVRLYSADELEALLLRAGLRTEQRYGDYEGSRLDPASPRCILMGKAV